MSKRDAIQTIIADMRAEASAQSAKHEAAYFAALQNTKFAEADKQIRAITAALGKASAESRNTVSLISELAKAVTVRDKLFASYYTPTKTIICSKCNNTGYAAKGKLCSCVLKKYSQQLSDVSGLSKTAPKSFGANLTSVFKDKAVQDNMKKIYASLAQYCEKFPDVKKNNIVLSGGTGTGKTYASQVVASVLLERGFSVLYLTAFALIQRFKDYIFNFEKAEKLDPLFSCDFLVIDDLGTEPVIKNITQEYLYNVINERMASGKAFLITTNLSPDAIKVRYDQRLTSRLLSAQTTALIEMKGSDLRLS